MNEADLSLDRLKSLLSYDPVTGVFRWLVKRGNRAAGYIADNVDGKGYIRIKIDGQDFRAHRLAWFYMTGRWPSDQIDHVDLNKQNNAFANLREASNSQNNANRAVASNNLTGHKGVSFDAARKKWRAEIKHLGKASTLGRFDNLEEAAAAYREAAGRAFGAFARHN